MKQLHSFIFAAALLASALPHHAVADSPVCEWTMVTNKAGAVLNTGTAESAGNLSLAAGAAMSEDVQTGNSGGLALRFPAENPTAAAESASTFDPLAGAEKFTIMAWVRRESGSELANQSARIFSDIDTRGNVASGVEFRFSGEDGNLTLRINGTEVQTSYGIEPDNWSWHHVAVVYDGTIASIGTKKAKNAWFYIDGVQRGVGNNMEGLVVEANDVPVAIGNSAAGRVAGNLMVGSIDDVFVFNGWAPSPSGNGNFSLDIRGWMLVDDIDRVPQPEEEEEPEPTPTPEDEGEHAVPPVMVEDVVVQKIGTERNYENLPEGLIFINADDGELWFANEENPQGRAVCLFKGFPDWHSFHDTVRLNGNKLLLNPYYSLMAESHALSARYGTNTVWSVVGLESGDLAGLTVSLADENTLMLSCNAVGDGVTLQVCTNLMETTPWKTATNAVVVEETDVAITWRVTLMTDQPGAEIYRVLNNGASIAAGFHIYPELHPHGGIEMGGVTVTNWGDVTNGVNARIAAHESASNPHGITAAGIGALTSESDAEALAALATHTGNTANPHGVTAAQAGALPAVVDEDEEDEAYVVEYPTRFSWPVAAPAVEMAEDEDGEYEVPRIWSPFTAATNNGLAVYYSQNRSYGYGLVLNTPLSFLRMSMGERARLVFSREVPRGPEKAHLEADEVTIKAGVYDEEEEEWVPGQIKLDGNVYAAGNSTLDGDVHVEGNMTVTDDLDVGRSLTAKSLTVGTGTTTNLSELATAASVSAVTGRVSAIEADYVTSADIGDFATTQAVASVERRLNLLERTDTCSLWWSDDTMSEGSSESNYNWIPTNFPTPRLRIFVVATNGLHNISIPQDFTPGRPVSLNVAVWGNSANTTNYMRYGTTIVQTLNGSISRVYDFEWDDVLLTWTVVAHTTSVSPNTYSGGQRFPIPPNAPATVSTWLELHPEWATP